MNTTLNTQAELLELLVWCMATSYAQSLILFLHYWRITNTNLDAYVMRIHLPHDSHTCRSCSNSPCNILFTTVLQLFEFMHTNLCSHFGTCLWLAREIAAFCYIYILFSQWERHDDSDKNMLKDSYTAKRPWKNHPWSIIRQCEWNISCSSASLPWREEFIWLAAKLALVDTVGDRVDLLFERFGLSKTKICVTCKKGGKVYVARAANVYSTLLGRCWLIGRKQEMQSAIEAMWKHDKFSQCEYVASYAYAFEEARHRTTPCRVPASAEDWKNALVTARWNLEQILTTFQV